MHGGGIGVPYDVGLFLRRAMYPVLDTLRRQPCARTFAHTRRAGLVSTLKETAALVRQSRARGESDVHGAKGDPAFAAMTSFRTDTANDENGSPVLQSAVAHLTNSQFQRRRLRRSPLTFACALMIAACAPRDDSSVSPAQRAAIADTLRTAITRAYDLTAPGDKVARLMSLYPPSGPVVSASGGQVTTSRDSLQDGIRAFWENVGRNMQKPKWTWGAMHVDVLSPNAAALTTTYSVAHLTPRGEPHVIAGAWTAVFQRRAGKWVIVQEHLSDVPMTVRP